MGVMKTNTPKLTPRQREARRLMAQFYRQNGAEASGMLAWVAARMQPPISRQRAWQLLGHTPKSKPAAYYRARYERRKADRTKVTPPD